MTNKLKDYLKETWEKIGESYERGDISSERHLQALLYHELTIIPEFSKDYRIFIEPHIYSDNQEIEQFSIIGIVPDILITRNDEIICVFEIKYKPNAYVPYQKDITNFGKFNDIKGTRIPIYLETNSINGNWNYERPFRVDEEILFAYGIIAKESSDAFNKTQDIWENKSLVNYIQLIGSVNSRTNAKFYFIPQ